MGVAVSGQHPDATMFPEQPVPNRKAFLLLGDIAQGVFSGGVDELGDVRS